MNPAMKIDQSILQSDLILLPCDTVTPSAAFLLSEEKLSCSSSTVRWWSKAVNFISLLSRAAVRTPARSHHTSAKEKWMKWNGWHAFRRGLTTNLHEVGVPTKVIQRVCCHPHRTGRAERMGKLEASNNTREKR
jgi:hypothetical protein